MGKRSLVWVLPLAFIIFILFLIQFSQASVIGADGFLHGRLALMIVKEGFLKSLPQAHFSWFAVRFSDKDFLYHLYLIPFVTVFGFMLGTKVGALLATGLLATTVVVLLKVNGKHAWTPWFGLGILLSSQFLRDTAEARPFVFAILLTLLGIHVVIQKKFRWIFVVSLLYGMMHLSAWILPVLALFFAVFEWVTSGKKDYKPFVSSLAGWLFSFILHPNFPTNIFYFYLNGILVPWYAAKTGVLELGAEFFPLNTQEVFVKFPFFICTFPLLLILSGVYQVRYRRETSLWGIATMTLFLMGLVAKRNMTHLYPISVVFIGLALTDFFQEGRHHEERIGERARSILGIAGFLLIVFAVWQTATGLSQTLFADRVYGEHFIKVAQLLHDRAPQGSRIFHANWSDSQYLIGLAPEYEYFVTLDPIYMYSYNKDLYNLYRHVSFGQSQDPYTIFRDTFGVRFGYAGKNYFTNLVEQVRRDPRFTIEGEDELGLVFSLRP